MIIIDNVLSNKILINESKNYKENTNYKGN